MGEGGAPCPDAGRRPDQGIEADVRIILLAGRVYVGGRATGVADVTVVVGEDLAGD
jgi:hypothetical protein